ncbi:hypothetical protein MF573_05470 [Klebsiella pneumoniae]|nr:hypothetical protein MF573_05470 [Klebsiella pneumoniae]
MGLKILPPDINSGLYHFHVNDDGEIVYGIGGIKGVGEGPIEAIIEARNKGGYFRELFDLCARTDTKKLKPAGAGKNWIMSGAFDRLGPHRAALMNSLGDALKAADQHAKAEAIGQADMFGVLAEEPEQIEQSYASCQPWPEQVVLDGERETLGLYPTGHPINQYLKEIERYVGGVRLKLTCTRQNVVKSSRLRGFVDCRCGLWSPSAAIVSVSARWMTVPGGWKRCCLLTPSINTSTVAEKRPHTYRQRTGQL